MEGHRSGAVMKSRFTSHDHTPSKPQDEPSSAEVAMEVSDALFAIIMVSRFIARQTTSLCPTS